MEIKYKSFTGIELKADKPGSFTARIATLGVIDKDGDVTLPGAFPQGKEILISAYDHTSWSGGLPIGKGFIRENGNDVLVDGELNLNSATGKEHYETIKFAPHLQEWSYGFKILEIDEESAWKDNPNVFRVLKRLDVFEASPVLRGAGVETATLAIKSDDKGATYSDQTEAVLAAAHEWLARTKSLADLRRKDGRVLSAANRERLGKCHESLTSVVADLKDLLDTTAPTPAATPDDGKAVLAHALLLKTKINQEMLN